MLVAFVLLLFAPILILCLIPGLVRILILLSAPYPIFSAPMGAMLVLIHLALSVCLSLSLPLPLPFFLPLSLSLSLSLSWSSHAVLILPLPLPLAWPLSLSLSACPSAVVVLVLAPVPRSSSMLMSLHRRVAAPWGLRLKSHSATTTQRPHSAKQKTTYAACSTHLPPEPLWQLQLLSPMSQRGSQGPC